MCCSVLQCVTVCCSADKDPCVLTVFWARSAATERCSMRRECHQYIPVCCSVLQCVAVCYSVLQCAAVCCSVLQCFAVCCRVLQCLPRKCCMRKECRHCIALHCCVLWCDSVCSSVLQCITVRCSVLQRYPQEQRYMKGISSVCRACGIVCCIVRCFNIYMYGLWLYYARVSRGYLHVCK